MKIVADKAIPFLKGVFEPYSEVLYRDGSSFTREDVHDADALITRTRTRCDAELLDGSSVSLIASATIGLDHIDASWCKDHGISFVNAPGCNACGVVQYVFAAIYGIAARKGFCLGGRTIGIIGAGNVGRRVASVARRLGFNVLLNDPPREAREGSAGFCSLDELLSSSDIVTVHVPLADDTFRMADSSFFSKMKPGACFINAARGEVVDEQALMQAAPTLGAIVLDTWNHEPDINRDLLDLVDIATPHIAGYSYQGKQNGTAAAVRAVANHFGIDGLKDFFPPTEDPGKNPQNLVLDGLDQEGIAFVLQGNYPIFTDDEMLRSCPERFEELRKYYDYRAEFRIDGVELN